MLPVLAVSAIVVTGRRLLVVRRDTGPFAGRWSLPGGKVEAGERLKNAVAREVREEAGLRVKPGSVAGVHEVVVDGWHFVIIVHHATEIGGRLQPGDDAASVDRIPLNRVSRLRSTPGLVSLLRSAGVL